MITIEPFTLEDCKGILKPYQLTILNALVAHYGEEEAAKQWIMSQGPCQVSVFGGQKQLKDTLPNYWMRLKHEFDKFICGHTDYVEERGKFVTTGNAIGLASLTAISNWIGPIIDLSPVLILPSLVLLLRTAAKMGVNAYCSVIDFEKDV